VLVQGVVVNLSDGAVLVHQVLVSLLATETGDSSKSSTTNGNSDCGTRADQDSLLSSAVQDGAKNTTLSRSGIEVPTLDLRAISSGGGVVGDARSGVATDILVGAAIEGIDASTEKVARSRVAEVVGDVVRAVFGYELASSYLIASGVDAANVGGSANHGLSVASQGIGGSGRVALVNGTIVSVIARNRREGAVLAVGGAHPLVDGARVAVVARLKGEVLAHTSRDVAGFWCAKSRAGAPYGWVATRGNSAYVAAQVQSAKVSVGAVGGLGNALSEAAHRYIARIGGIACNGSEHAVSIDIAGVRGAKVVVIAGLVDVRAARRIARVAVVDGARVVVVASGAVLASSIDAVAQRGIQGTVYRCLLAASSDAATVVHTLAALVAVDDRVLAARRGDARVGGARVVVVARDVGVLAQPSDQGTGIVGARVVIVARHGGVDASNVGLAAIDCASIVVVAGFVGGRASRNWIADLGLAIVA